MPRHFSSTTFDFGDREFHSFVVIAAAEPELAPAMIVVELDPPARADSLDDLNALQPKRPHRSNYS